MLRQRLAAQLSQGVVGVLNFLRGGGGCEVFHKLVELVTRQVRDFLFGIFLPLLKGGITTLVVAVGLAQSAEAALRQLLDIE